MGEGGNRTTMILGTVSLVLKCVTLGLVCICLGVGIGAVDQVNGTAGEWLWAWTVSAFLLPLALMIGARLMDRPIPKELELAYLILGAYGTHLALGPVVSLSKVADAVIVAVTMFKQG